MHERSLSTQFAFTTKLKVRKGPGLLDRSRSRLITFARLRSSCAFRIRLGQYTALQVNGVLQSDPYMPGPRDRPVPHPARVSPLVVRKR